MDTQSISTQESQAWIDDNEKNLPDQRQRLEQLRDEEPAIVFSWQKLGIAFVLAVVVTAIFASALMTLFR